MSTIDETLPTPEDGASDDVLDDIVAEIEEMNGDDWPSLLAAGVSAESVLRVEFAFAAPTEDAADELAEHLRTVTDYEVATGGPESEEDEWVVTGTTGEVSLNGAAIAAWVRGMAALGWASGRCRFDGWSALVG